MNERKEIRKMSRSFKVYLNNERLVKRFSAIKRYLGVKSDPEVIRVLINWFWKHYREEIGEPILEHLNVDQDGTLIFDRNINDVVKVRFEENGMFCETCQVKMCPHIEFAQSIPEIQEALRKKGKPK